MAWGSAVISAIGLLVAIPVLTLLTLSLLPIALVTTALAACALSCRAAFIYLELSIGIATDWLMGRNRRTPPSRASTSRSPSPILRTKSLRSVASSTGSQTPLATAPIYASPLDRDFEGIGGWRVAADDDDAGEEQWLMMNARLELPGVANSGRATPEERKRPHHRRHATSGSLPAVKAETRRTAARRPHSTVLSESSGTATPAAGGFEGRGKAKSLTQMGDILVARRGARRKSSSSSSGSGNTLVM